MSCEQALGRGLPSCYSVLYYQFEMELCIMSLHDRWGTFSWT